MESQDLNVSELPDTQMLWSLCLPEIPVSSETTKKQRMEAVASRLE